MPLSRAGAAGHGAVVRRGGSARRDSGSDRIDRGARGDQVDHWRGNSADWQDGLLRHAVGQGLRANFEDPQRSEVPGMQRASYANDADRLRSVLRFRRACEWNRARGTNGAHQRGSVVTVTFTSTIWLDWPRLYGVLPLIF